MARFRRNRFPRLVALADLEDGGASLETAGAAALALLEARKAGLAVLDAWLVSADVFRDVARTLLPPAHDPASLLRIIHRPAGLERAARARERLLELPLPEVLSSELAWLWGKLQSQARWGLRVRASATCADRSISAMAGIECEVVGVRGEQALEDAVRRVWSALVYADALRYLRVHKMRDIACGVLIEALEPVAASGVLLSEDPKQPARLLTNTFDDTDPSPVRRVPVRVASAALGLGAPVIDGASARDIVRLSADGEIVEARIATKKQRWVVGDAGLELQPVPNDKARRPALKPKTLAELLHLASRGERLGYGNSRLDFIVLRGGELRVADVQRVAGNGWPDAGSATTVWSRGGLGESLPGVPTPLTGSLAEDFEEQGLRHGLESLGCKVTRGTALVRRVHGRYYVNLSMVLPALRQVPGIEPGALSALIAPDAVDTLRLDHQLHAASSLARLPVVAARLLTQQKTLTDEVQRFEREAEQQRRWLAEMDLAILPDDSLKTTLLETRDFFQRTGKLLFTASVAVIAGHLGLKAVLSRSNPVLADRLAQIISTGVADLDSSALGIALSHVTAIAHKDPAARERLLTGSIRHPNELPAGPARRAIQQFLDAYGERAVRESELMTARFGESPEPVLAMILAGLRDPPKDPEQRVSAARVAADREWAALEARLPYIEKTLVRALVARSRVFTRLRDRMRLWMARTLNMLRIVTLDVDRRLRRLDVSLTEGAAFFCTFDELVSAVGSYRADLGPLIRLRRATFERDSARPDPPEMFVGIPGPLALPPLGSVVLHGMGASPGVVTGRARLVGPRAVEAATVEPGEILVLRSLDVALAPLFLLAGGVVCELGSTLSHGAVVAREYGVPAVVGVAAASTTIHDGERLRVDGDRGIVERLEA